MSATYTQVNCANIQFAYNPGSSHTIKIEVANAMSDLYATPGKNAIGMSLNAMCYTSGGWVNKFNSGSPGWLVKAPMEVAASDMGVLESKTENNLKETYGHKLDMQSMSWSKVGFRRPSFSAPFGKLQIGVPPALGGINIDSNRKPDWQFYTFSDMWFWSDVGLPAADHCPDTPGKINVSNEDGCYSLDNPLCPNGEVNLYPTYDQCYQFIENAACWDGQTQFGKECWLWQGTPSVCPSDGYSYTIKTPPTANYVCYTTAEPSCPVAGSVQEGAYCYTYASPYSCPAGTQLDTYSGYCYETVDQWCPGTQLAINGACYNFLEPSCPSGQFMNGYYCYDVQPDGMCPTGYQSLPAPNGYFCVTTTRTTTDYRTYVGPQCHCGNPVLDGECYDVGKCYRNYSQYGYPHGYFLQHYQETNGQVCYNDRNGQNWGPWVLDCACTLETFTDPIDTWVVPYSCKSCAAGYTSYNWYPFSALAPCVKQNGYSCPTGYSYGWNISPSGVYGYHCYQYVQSSCPSGYYYDFGLGKCRKNVSYVCDNSHYYYWDRISQQCKRFDSYSCNYGSYWSYNASTNTCERNIPAECPTGQSKKTDPNTNYYACYILDTAHGQPPGHIYCRNSLTFFNDRCYEYKEPICGSQPYDIILGSANPLGEWTGNCWKKYFQLCPTNTFRLRGEHTTDIHCLKPELEVATIKSPVTADEFGSTFCNAILWAHAGNQGFKPCTNVVQYGGWSGCPDSFYVGEGMGPWKCPLNPKYDCIQITEFIAMCGTDKPCAACYPDNIKDNAYNYIEIQEIKTIPNTNPVKKTGMYKYKYAYPNATKRVSNVSGRLPEPSEVSVIQSLWGVTDFWVNGQIPTACQLDPNSSGCLSDERTTIVIWDDATKAGFYAPCVYDQQGNAVCTGDAVECVNNVCPLNSAYPCVDYNGKKICSTTKCYSAADPAMGETEIVTIDDSMYQNDGERDDNGDCLGQVYIFTGKASRCRPPGVSVGLLNDCCESGDKVMSDSTGSALDIYGAISTIKTIYHLGQVAYYTNAVLNSGSSVTFEYLTNGTARIYTYATNGTAQIYEMSADVAKSVEFGVTSGTGVEGAMTNFIKGLFNPTTILITVAVMIVTKLLFGSCDQNDITTDLLRDSKYCHFVGDYCEKKWPIIGCVQKAKGYCCFNSKLGRIIHEQGRPQLESFGRDGGWGEAKKPNCRGFKPEEFQMLDFSKIDISEYIEDIQKDMDKKLTDMQKNLNDKVNNFLNPGTN